MACFMPYSRRMNDPIAYLDLAAQMRPLRKEIDAAIAALRRGVQMKDSGTAVVKVDPYLDPLRRDRRFTSFVASLHLPT